MLAFSTTNLSHHQNCVDILQIFNEMLHNTAMKQTTHQYTTETHAHTHLNYNNNKCDVLTV